MPKYSNIRCNKCHHLLTEKEASVYDLIWRHSGDMYCMKHRVCPDDCRKQPCQEVKRQQDELKERNVSAWHKNYVIFPYIKINGERYITELNTCQDNETGKCYIKLPNGEIRFAHYFYQLGETHVYCNTRDRYALTLNKE